ncbi:acyltransferase family protein [soil metagenome]
MTSLDPLPTTTTPVKERVPYLDNARYWVMILVVVGHSLTELRSNDVVNGIYTWLYAFHMPVFILISGYTARNYVGDFRQVQRLVSTLLLPYILVETTLQLMMRHYTGEPDPLMILSPQWLGWFIIALFLWRLMTPILRALKYPITTSIIVSLLIGLIEVPNVLALPKVLGLLPFYVVGLHLKIEHFRMLSSLWIRASSVLLLGASLAIAIAYSDRWTFQWLLWKYRYDEDPLLASPAEGVVQRAALLALGFILSAAVLSIIPWARSWTSNLGTRTVYCYLLHGYIILYLDQQFDFFDKVVEQGWWAIIAVAVGAAIVANVLMTKPVGKLFRPLFEPRQSWMFRT